MSGALLKLPSKYHVSLWARWRSVLSAAYTIILFGPANKPPSWMRNGRGFAPPVVFHGCTMLISRRDWGSCGRVDAFYRCRSRFIVLVWGKSRRASLDKFISPVVIKSWVLIPGFCLAVSRCCCRNFATSTLAADGVQVEICGFMFFGFPIGTSVVNPPLQPFRNAFVQAPNVSFHSSWFCCCRHSFGRPACSLLLSSVLIPFVRVTNKWKWTVFTS